MKTNYLLYGIIALLLFVIGLIAGRTNQRVKEVVKFHTDTVTVVRIDTLVIREPKPYKVVEYRTDTIAGYKDGEPIYVPVPIKAYSFKSDEYKAEITGFNVDLQSIEVYPKTIYKTITNQTEITRIKQKRWGIGISAGYGFSKDGLSPYVGVGLQYNIIEF